MIRFTKVSEAQFSLEYDGDAVKQGLMDVRELGPALIAVGELLETTNAQLNRGDTELKVLAHADFRAASFDVNLTVLQNVLSHAKTLLTGQEIKDAEEVLEVAGLAGKKAYLGYLALKRLLRGRKIDAQSKPDQEGKITIQISGNMALTKKEVLDLLTSDKANRAAEQIMHPLKTSGIDVVRFRDDKKEIVDTIAHEDLPAFEVDNRPFLTSPDLNIQTLVAQANRNSRTTSLRLLQPSFQRANKWYVAEGDNKFYVSIEDQAFLDRVERDEIAFTAHGRLAVVLMQELTLGKTKDTISYTVPHVIAYVKGAEQTPLFTPEDGERP